MEYVERYVVELEDGSFALWGKFVQDAEQSILAMEGFYDGTLFQKEYAELKVAQINKGQFLFLGEPKKAKCIREVEMKII